MGGGSNGSSVLLFRMWSGRQCTYQEPRRPHRDPGARPTGVASSSTMSPTASANDAAYHFAASGIAAIVNFPLWRASAIAQSGFKLEGSNMFVRYYKAVMTPPYKGVAATMFGMTWARGFIFFGSDVAKDAMKAADVYEPLQHTLGPLIIGTFVQVVNMPLVRATITIQDPSCQLPNVRSALVDIYKRKGVSGLWHGVSAGIMKTVPKYVTAVAVKDYMEEFLPRAENETKVDKMLRSGVKSVSAGLAGAILTNPLDVLRNE
jgi:hypothetical protein